MKIITKQNDLLEISGGINVSGSVINAFAKGIESILNVGRSLGTAIRRLYSGNLCKI
ncbi:MAG: hypothetical protein IJO43_02355 [Bacilli bacterium]|nr:hypothetical protein [Bacilli bacterium]